MPAVQFWLRKRVRFPMDRCSRISGRLVVLVLGIAAEHAFSATFDGAFNTTNDFGDVGLLQTPSARMRAEGEFGVGISTVQPYNQVHIFLQPLPWMETSVRYVDVVNRLYGDPSFSGNQTYKDKSVDLKLRLLREGEYHPAVVLGIQDVGGTGLFSSEYFAASYHYYSLDFSFGLGWGRLGSNGGIRNPFSLISSHFDHDRTVDQAGSFNASRLFTGHDIGPFGGVQWNTPIKGLALQLEYDGNNYQHEGLGDNQRQSSPVNVALNYRGLSNFDVGVGYERGNTVMARLSLHLNFQDKRSVIKSADPLPVAVRVRDVSPEEQDVRKTGQGLEPAPRSDGGASKDASERAIPAQDRPDADHRIPQAEQSALALRIKAELVEQGFALAAMDYDASSGELKIWSTRSSFRNPAKAAGRLARILSALAPPQVIRFTLIHMERGVEIYRISIPREEFEQFVRGKTEAPKLQLATVLSGPDGAYNRAEFIDGTRYPKFTWDMGPSVRQYIGGPNNFYVGQLYWRFDGEVNINDQLSFAGSAGVNIINNFSELNQESNSTLPHVRSDIIDYLKKGQNGLVKLESNYIASPVPDWYARASAGIFEEMYAGVAAELLYRPYGWPWALGFDVNHVWQRGYDQLLDFRGYNVTTAFATLYYQLPVYGILAKISAGRYLARDRGGTIDLSREFANGIRAGLWATKTNVSSAQFGEGSFDKGLYLIVPLDIFFTQSTRRYAAFPFRPLTRDGGQRARDGNDLYGIVEQGQPHDFAAGWSDFGH